MPVERYESESGGVRVTVIKDGGDDPDATHGCDIQVVVTVDHSVSGPLSVDVDGGKGVGRVTLPGLPVDVGKAAINPDPLRQIEMGVRKAASMLEGGRIAVLVEVPEGEALAQKTMNPRLGIKGGISILGTQGIVKPYSHDSWKATIEEGLDVARAQGIDRVVFTTGRRSERLFLEAEPDTPELALVQAADFFEFAMQAAVKRGVVTVVWSLFFGKLAKQAQGLAYTHAKTHPVDFELLADRCEQAGCAMLHTHDIRTANTARQVLELLRDDSARDQMIRLLVHEATQAAILFSGGACRVEYAVFDFDGSRLY